MRNKKLKRQVRGKRAALILVVRLLLSTTAMAGATSSGPDSGTLAQMRIKQEGEENSVVRVIQQPVTVNQNPCTHAEMARQRIRDLGGKDEQKFGTISVEAGHEEVAIDNNSGRIDNSVNVEVVAPNDRKCF